MRNPFLPRMSFFFPLLIMLVMPWVATMDVHHIGVAVVDKDHSSISRRIIHKIEASEYFTLRSVTEDYADQFDQLEAGKIDAILEIPNGFERDVKSSTPQKVSIASNGVDATRGTLGMQYLMKTLGNTLNEIEQEMGMEPSADAAVVQNRYNPTLEYRNYMIPALMIMLLIIMCGFLPALNIVSEKEIGTIEQINVTPVSQFVFILAKLIPYWIIGFLTLVIAMLLSWWVYGLVPVGSVGSIFLASLLFIWTMSGFGVVCANYSSTMMQVMLTMFFFVVILVLMSGLLTPISSMPIWAQDITYVLPPRYYIDIIRAIYLKGSSIMEMGSNFIMLGVFATVFNLAAALSYRKRS